MKIKTLFLALSLIVNIFFMQASYAEAVIQAKNSNQSVTLDMQNMTCGMCKFTIKKALQDVEGVKQINVDSDAKTATVIFDSQVTNIKSLIKATTNAGYPATVRHSK